MRAGQVGIKCFRMDRPGTYRIYCFDGLRDVWVTEAIDAADDAAAVLEARNVERAVKTEVWRGSTSIATLDSRIAD